MDKDPKIQDPKIQEFLSAARPALTNLRTRINRARSGKPGTARVELHVDIDDIELVVRLAEVANIGYKKLGY